MGKSSTALALARKLRDAGYRTGLVDVDVTKADLGHMMDVAEQFDRIEVTPTHILPMDVDGIKLFSLSCYPEAERATLLEDKNTLDMINQMFTTVDWSGVDYLVVDAPPTTQEITQELVKILNKPDDGFIIVTTPNKTPVVGGRMTLDMLNFYKVNVLGCVVNQAYIPCPNCNQLQWFDYTPEQVEGQLNLPVLSVIPFVLNGGKIEDHIDLKTILDALNSGPKISLRGR
ncbi:P-loop NTPase [Candidatus Pacearchaeota archaeon]|nr:P-loop NTPase [Candidatus Pacearchaeota archaeon]